MNIKVTNDGVSIKNDSHISFLSIKTENFKIKMEDIEPSAKKSIISEESDTEDQDFDPSSGIVIETYGLEFNTIKEIQDTMNKENMDSCMVVIANDIKANVHVLSKIFNSSAYEIIKIYNDMSWVFDNGIDGLNESNYQFTDILFITKNLKIGTSDVGDILDDSFNVSKTYKNNDNLLIYWFTNEDEENQDTVKKILLDDNPEWITIHDGLGEPTILNINSSETIDILNDEALNNLLVEAKPVDENEEKELDIWGIKIS